jgi:predicted HTH domain antitoxin
MELVRQERVSKWWAAESLGLSLSALLDLLAAHDIPHLDLSEEVLRQDLEASRSHRERLASSQSQTPPP